MVAEKIRNADCLVAEKTIISSFLKFYRVGILYRIFKWEREQEHTIPPRLEFEIGLENIYMFRDGNEIGVPSPKPASLSSLGLGKV